MTLETDDFDPRPPRRSGARALAYAGLALCLIAASSRLGGVQKRVNELYEQYLASRSAAAKQQFAHLLPKPAPGAPAGRPTAAPAPQAKPEEKPRRWTIRVTAYGMLDLKKVAGLGVVLRAPDEDAPIRPRLASGAFVFDVPSLDEGGYRLEATVGGAPARYIEDNPNLPYRLHGEDRRREEAEELRQQKVLHVPIRPDGAAASVDYPIVILP